MNFSIAHKNHQGAALISMLFLASLMAVLVIAMLLLSQSEMKSADTYSTQINVDSLDQMATNLVIAQIRSATTRSGNSWASQPGAIRVRGQDGAFVAGYKLYSDDDMIVTNESDLLLDLADADWETQPEHYVDLNEPALIDGKANFPILDPRAAGNVEGFSFDETISGTVVATNETARLPMPTRWLYILQDGTTGHLDSSSGEFIGVRANGDKVTPDADNPIVGRIAFWADDESCKININTASEPTFWDTPRSVSREDLWYARSQPTRQEYQRYPGHPATTALSPVLFADQITRETQGQLEANSNINANVAIKESIYDLIPRVNTGGSKAGTAITLSATPPSDDDDDRLFSSIDEFIFQAPRLQITNAREQSTVVDRELLEKSRFFLTAHSRAPELNLFGLPRVSMWPTDDISKTNRHLTNFDELIRFCSTTSSGFDYFFTRKNADSSTDDWEIQRNQEIYNYLKELTSANIPGVGNSLASKFGPDHEQVLTEIFDYIRSTNLHDDNHPRNATKFTDRHGRRGHGQVRPIQIGETMGFGRFLTISEFVLLFICNADPEFDESVTQIIGQNGITSVGDDEKVIQMAFIPEAFIPGQGWNGYYTDARFVIEGLDGLQINGTPLFPSKSRIAYTPDSDLTRGTHGRAWGGPSGFRGTTNSNIYSDKIKINVGEAVEDDQQRMSFSQTKPITITIYGGTTEIDSAIVQTIDLEFPNAEFPVPQLQTTGTPENNDNNLARTTNSENWWNMADRFGRKGRVTYAPWTAPNNNSPATATRNPDWIQGALEGAVFREGDVMRSLAPFHSSTGSSRRGGDYRLVAMTKDIESNVFLPHAGYFDVDQRIDHTLSMPAGCHYYYHFGNADLHLTSDGLYPEYDYRVSSQLTDSSYHFSKFPDFPRGYARSISEMISSTPIHTGDFDNGVAMVADGPFLNKPDEGNIQLNNGVVRANIAFADSPTPYFDRNWVQSQLGPAYFTPNRQISSPVMFGSLPTGVKREIPWQTLLFRPQSWGHPNAIAEAHPGYEDPKDHYLLDLFWMPVVEPYAISEPFSTAGKVNLNYQILPFTNIKRATGIHSILKAEEMLIVKDEEAAHYKNYDHALADYYVPPIPAGSRWRQFIDIEETIKQFDDRFLNGEIFNSASEICDIHLVPLNNTSPVVLPEAQEGFPNKNRVNDIMRDFWLNHSPVGDNARERPYSNIYPRVTSKSNVYRVHVRAQSIKKARSSDPKTFDPNMDNIGGEWRGSTLIERFIDPNNDDIPDYATEPNSIGFETLERFYRFRIIYRKRFNS